MDLFHAGERNKSFFLFIYFFYDFYSFEVKQFSLSRSVRNNNLAQMIMVGVASYVKLN